MVEKTLLDDWIIPLRTHCNPLNVKIRVRCIRNKFYLVFNGKDTYTKVSDWTFYWHGFDEYVLAILRRFNIEAKAKRTVDDVNVIVYVGTLLDFLKGIKNEQV